MNTSRQKPVQLAKDYTYDSFSNGKPLLNKKKNHLPAMGWNSWNAFGSGNTAELTKIMADKIVELGLDKLGYRYIVLDDGCYKSERIDGKLSNETKKFPEGFKPLSDYIHAKGLKFGMYNDIGTNLCAGAAVGTCGYEDTDAQCYIDWGVDFLKVDNCYYLWDNATFSDAANAKYVYTPNIKSLRIVGNNYEKTYSAVSDGALIGSGVKIQDDYVTNIGTFDGTNVGTTPVGAMSGELVFDAEVPSAGDYSFYLTYATGEEVGCGSWLQLAVNDNLIYDDFLPATDSTTTFTESTGITASLRSASNRIRIMNHRRQENTLNSYAALLDGLNKAAPSHDIIFSICEWGKTQPQNWGYKVGDSWRILNDITFRVGADGDPGYGEWYDEGTPSVTSQYNKCVIMDEFAGLDKGWNDPDMMMIGMNGLTEAMCKTHMAMWCMMNSPLMLGLDLRRVKKGDSIYNIIANKNLIALNQDSLGIQAKRIFTTAQSESPDTEYIMDNNRCDILAKPLSDGSVALSFINLSNKTWNDSIDVNVHDIINMIGKNMVTGEAYAKAGAYTITDLWTGKTSINSTGNFEVSGLEAYGNTTIRITAIA